MPIIQNPSRHFQVVLATGANIKSSCEAVFGDGLYVIKDRANSNNWQWIDYVRGTSAVLQSNTTAAETTYTAPSGNSVGYCWKANGSAVTNTAGTITSQVSANTQAGFSIVTYTGTGAAATVGHGLGVVPRMVIVKSRSQPQSWVVWVGGFTGAEYLLLNSTAAKGSAANIWNSTVPTSSVFSIGTDVAVNINAATQVAYCFAEVPGFSRIGSYTGNGSADGPFVFCGFRPRWVMVKNASAAATDWVVWDAARSLANQTAENLEPNTPDAESASRFVDFTANGFKLRDSGSSMNGSTNTHIFIAFAESPFNYSRAR